MFLPRTKPRTFRYNPRFLQEKFRRGGRISFPRKTLYDPHQGGMRIFSLLLLVVLVSVLIWYLIPRWSTVKPERTTIRSNDVVIINFEKRK